MDNCIFCKIIRGEIPSQKVFENERYFAFRDIHPQAKTHVLVIPKTHVKNVLEADGYTVNCRLAGLGEYPGIRAIFAAHAQAAARE